jgi:hypothetical protein
MIDFEKESLLCMVVVDDRVAEKVYGAPYDKGGLRGFVLRDRVSGEVRGLYRFHRPDNTKSWYELKSDNATKLVEGLEEVFRGACSVIAPELKDPVHSFFPPDAASPEETIAWLVEQDLIELKEPKEKAKNG